MYLLDFNTIGNQLTRITHSEFCEHRNSYLGAMDFNTAARMLHTLPKTDRIWCGYQYIWFQNAFAFPVGDSRDLPSPRYAASTYLHRCVLCRESSDWRLSQGSICSTKFIRFNISSSRLSTLEWKQQSTKIYWNHQTWSAI